MQIETAKVNENNPKYPVTEFQLEPIGTKPKKHHESQYAQMPHEHELLSLAKHVYELNSVTLKLRSSLWTENQKIYSQELSIMPKKHSKDEATCKQGQN